MFKRIIVLLVLIYICNGKPPNYIEQNFDVLLEKYSNAEWRDEYLSLLETQTNIGIGEGEGQAAGGAEGGAGKQQAAGGAAGATTTTVGTCETCVYVIENKEQHQPYLCRGLKDPNYQKNCVQVLESLMWWLTNQVYWLNYGCQRSMNGAVEWVRPCPAHAVCSWLEQLYTRQTYCPADPYYKKPQ